MRKKIFIITFILTSIFLISSALALSTNETISKIDQNLEKFTKTENSKSFVMVIIFIFISLIAFAMFYLGYQRSAVMWTLLSVIIFVTLIIYSMSIPFSVDENGLNVGDPSNFMLVGISFMFTTISLIVLVRQAFIAFGGKNSRV